MNEITIYTQALPLEVKEYQGERVVTFKDVDTLERFMKGGGPDGKYQEN